MKGLEYLKTGKQTNRDEDNTISAPPNFDMDKFYRGRLFFQHNLFSCCVGMLFSLLLGLAYPDFLNTLVFTHKSDTPKKALHRYVATFKHIALWHYGNIWQPGSAAYESILTVRRIHLDVQKSLKHAGRENTLTQYHMGVVQTSFFVFPLLYSKDIGISTSEESLDDYVYFWYGIGYALGIDDKYNVCSSGRLQAEIYCEEIRDKIVLPNLNNPSEEFHIMTAAFLDGWRPFLHGSMSVSFVITYFKHLPTKTGAIMAFTDYLRYIFWNIVFFLLRNIDCFRKILNHGVERIFNLKFC